MDGYEAGTGKITNLDGGISLVNAEDELAASWSFKGMMEHWNRKHAQAAYIPSIFQTPPPEYAYGRRILLCEQTDFLLFLKAFSSGVVYYDPAVKIENASFGDAGDQAPQPVSGEAQSDYTDVSSPRNR